MATVILPRSLLQLFPAAERRVALPGSTVGELIDGLEARWPGMRDRLCTSGPAIREHINLFVDGEPADIGATVGESSVVHVIPAVAGGSRPEAEPAQKSGRSAGDLDDQRVREPVV